MEDIRKFLNNLSIKGEARAIKVGIATLIAVYDEFYKEPLSHTAHELLHTTYNSKKHMLGEDAEKEVSSEDVM